MAKACSFQFYPEDWLSNIKLQLCSMTSQGLLINLMCLMHQSEKYGYLLINGSKPIQNQSKTNLKPIQKLFRMNSKTFNNALNELLDYGVLKQDDDGVLFCRRMVQDEHIRQLRKEAGEKGGNPAFKLGKPNPYYKDNQKDKQKDKQKITPSSSSSSSSSSSPSKEDKEKILLAPEDTELALYLSKLMTDNNPDRKPTSESILNKWANTCRLMRERDKRTKQGIKDHISFSQQDEFWKQNILSMDKLRKQYDTLTLKMKKDDTPGHNFTDDISEIGGMEALKRFGERHNVNMEEDDND